MPKTTLKGKVLVTTEDNGNKTFEVVPDEPELETKAMGLLSRHGGRLEGANGQLIGRQRTEAKPSDVAKIAAARKVLRTKRLMERLAKSAMTGDQKAALTDALSDEQARGVYLPIAVVKALFDEPAELALANGMLGDKTILSARRIRIHVEDLKRFRPDAIEAFQPDADGVVDALSLVTSIETSDDDKVAALKSQLAETKAAAAEVAGLAGEAESVIADLTQQRVVYSGTTTKARMAAKSRSSQSAARRFT